VAAAVEDLPLVLGEGPGVDAIATDRPVLVADLADHAVARHWPTFAPAAVTAGVRALFALPLRIGPVRVGVLDLYRAQPGALTAPEEAEALVVADAVALHLLMDGHAPVPPAAGRAEPRRTAVVHQATGMIMAQLAVGPAEAAVRLRAYSYADGRSLTEVSPDVVERRLHFDDLGD
jgi:hypothetical protein